MRTWLAITVDVDVLALAKQYARSPGVSLSSLVEQSLREVVGAATPSFASRWRGRLQQARHDHPRHEALARRYL